MIEQDGGMNALMYTGGYDPSARREKSLSPTDVFSQWVAKFVEEN